MLPSWRAWHHEPYILKSRTPWKLTRSSTPCVVLSAEGVQYVRCAVIKERISSEQNESSAKPCSLWIKTRSALSCWKRIVIGGPSKWIPHQPVMQEEYENARPGPFVAYYKRKVQVSWMGNPFTRWFVRLKSLSPLTPMKTKPVLPPPGVFQREDLYLRKRWRRVQHLSCEFWTRWKKEFLHSLQEKSKWTKPRRKMQVGDVVIVKDDNRARNRWSLAREIETYPNKDDGLVRSAKVAMTRECTPRQFWKDPFKS